MLYFRRSSYQLYILRKKVLVFKKLNFSSRFYNKLFFWLPHRVVIFVKFVTVRNKYSRTIQSQIFLIRANKALEDNKYRRVLNNLKVALELLRDDLSPQYRRHLDLCYKSVLTQRNWHANISSEIVELTRVEVNAGNESCLDSYYYLSKYLNWAGFLSAGFLAREKAVSLSQMMNLDHRSAGRQVEMSLAANLELGDIERASYILDTFYRQIPPSRLMQFRFHLSLLRTEETQFINTGVNEFYESEIRLSELVRGKSVALVGAGNTLGDYGEEIDSCDLVVRVKYPGMQNLPPAEKHGRRCDIAYFTSLEPFQILSEGHEKLRFLKELKFLMVAQKAERNNFQDVPILYLSNLRSVFPNGDLTSGMQTLANLLRFQPSSLKLFGFDFYATPNLYNPEMIGFYRKDGWLIGDPTLLGNVDPDSFPQRVQGHFWHDQIANFSFARNLFRANIIKTEIVSAEILSLTPKQYALSLEMLLRDLFLRF